MLKIGLICRHTMFTKKLIGMICRRRSKKLRQTVAVDFTKKKFGRFANAKMFFCKQIAMI